LVEALLTLGMATEEVALAGGVAPVCGISAAAGPLGVRLGPGTAVAAAGLLAGEDSAGEQAAASRTTVQIRARRPETMGRTLILPPMIGFNK
jgi:hypothetical protein